MIISYHADPPFFICNFLQPHFNMATVIQYKYIKTFFCPDPPHLGIAKIFSAPPFCSGKTWIASPYFVALSL